MTQEQKDLLLKDLCARLPYGVKVLYKGEKYKISSISICNETITIYGERGYPIEVEIKNVKPYLFPLSSMTEGQTEELIKLINTGQNDNNEFMRSLCRIKIYHKYHFDYRGLIPMGLANDATSKNIY